MRTLFLSGIPYRKDTYGDFYFAAPRFINYGLLCLSAMLESKNLGDVLLLDLEFETKNRSSIIEKIKKYNPDVICVSIYTISRDKVFQLLREIKNALPKAVLVAGGPHVTIYPLELMQLGIADYCMTGECDYAFAEFIELFQKGEEVNNVSNLVYRKGDRIITNPARKFIDNLDELPFPAYHLIGKNIKKYHPQLMVYKRRPVVNIVSSRGCPYSCSFCSARALRGKIWKANSPEYVVDLIQHLIEQFKIKEFAFHESSFAVDRQRVISICKLLIKRDIKIYWTADVNLRNINEEVGYYMKKAGCWLLSCGIESGDDTILRSINKPITVKEIKEKVNFLTKIGINIRGYFMLGFVEETHKTLQATLDMSRELPLYSVNYSVLVPDPGSELYTKMFGEQLEKPVYELATYTDDVDSKRFAPKYISSQEIATIQKKAFYGFFLRWKQIFRFIKVIESFEDIRRYSLMVIGAIIMIARIVMRKIKTFYVFVRTKIS